MMQFTYYARSATGKSINGKMRADSSKIVADHLRARALIAIDIRGQNRIEQRLAPFMQRSTRQAMIVALRTLATLIGVGLPMRRALEIVLQSTRHAGLREGFAGVLASVEAGEALGAAMLCRQDLFSAMTIALIRAGERGGVLFETLEQHAFNLEQQYALQQRLLTTMIYPVIVLLTALGLMVFLMVSVLPMFASLFDQLHVEQPLVLRCILGIPAFFSPATVLTITCVCFAFSFGMHFLAKCDTTTTRFHLRVPLIDSLREKSGTARFSRALATLLKAGVPLPEALGCVQPILGLPQFRRAVARIGDALSDGNTFAAAIQDQGIFDPLMVHLVRIGEETGTLDAQLLRLAEWFERDLTQATTRAAALIEPLLIVGIGALVGTIVFSVFVPLYSLIGGIR